VLEAPEPAPAIEPARAEPEAEELPEGLVAAAELIVFDALSRAGGRLLTREHRGQFGGVDKWALHTVITEPSKSVLELLADSFLWADNVADAHRLDRDSFKARVTRYTRERLEHHMPHDAAALTHALRKVSRAR
jgi:hypothetical protein